MCQNAGSGGVVGSWVGNMKKMNWEIEKYMDIKWKTGERFKSRQAIAMPLQKLERDNIPPHYRR